MEDRIEKGSCLLGLNDRFKGKLRIPGYISEISEDAFFGIGDAYIELLSMDQVKSLRPLIKARRAVLYISYPEKLLLPFTHIGGFMDVFKEDHKLDLAAYDARFSHIQDKDFKLYMAIARILYPAGLSEKARASYLALLKSRFKPAVSLLCQGIFTKYERLPKTVLDILNLKKPDRFLKKDLLALSVSYGEDNMISFLSHGSLPEEGIDLNKLHKRLHRILGHDRDYGRNRALHNLACDISVSYLIDLWYGPYSQSLAALRYPVYDSLKKEGLSMTASSIADYFIKNDNYYKSLKPSVFYADDHENLIKTEGYAFYEPPSDPYLKVIERHLRKSGQGAGEKRGSFFSDQSGSHEEILDIRKREGNDYQTFLQSFMVFKEDRLLDLDSYDPVYYTLGLTRYGDIPLIEPLEMKEVNRLEELVIVIDTSGSCEGKLVRFFLEETWSVFSEQENFFDHFHVRLLQCDCMVKQDVKLTSLSEVDDYMEHMIIRGGGSTDFRAAFHYISELRKKGELRRLKGILYFTDGLGTYPEAEPDCTAAFIFLGERYKDVEVPYWAKKLLIPLPEGKEWELEYTGGFKANI